MLKLTKTDLKAQQYRLSQLEKYLPILILKRMLLQAEVNQADQELQQLQLEFNTTNKQVMAYCPLFSQRDATLFLSPLNIVAVQTQVHNLAGVEVPVFQTILFQEEHYSLFDSPVWLDPAVKGMQKLITFHEKIKIVKRKKNALEKELRSVSIRINLFEKVLIPRINRDITKIKIFLGDQQLSEICQAKLAKKKKIKREEMVS